MTKSVPVAKVKLGIAQTMNPNGIGNIHWVPRTTMKILGGRIKGGSARGVMCWGGRGK
jgi:hypothetical protein